MSWSIERAAAVNSGFTCGINWAKHAHFGVK